MVSMTNSSFPKELVSIIGVNIAAISFSAIISTKTLSYFKRSTFILYWIFAGIFVSLLPSLLFSSINSINITLIAVLFGIYFGVGMPIVMGYFAANTKSSNRSTMGGITFLFIGLSIAMLSYIGSENILYSCLILAFLKLMSLILLHLLKLNDDPTPTQNEVSYRTVLLNRGFMLYLLPWVMFNLTNYLTVPVLNNFVQGAVLIQLSLMAETIITALVAVLAGFLADIFGRKRILIIGFAFLGIGYAVLSISQTTWGWFFYICADGVAWGIFFTLFLFTVWGDLAKNKNSEKFYVVGAIPYLLSNFMRLMLEPYVKEVSKDVLFSYASVFIFLAVLPLIIAPETLPERIMKKRELENYVKEALKKVQKASKKEHSSVFKDSEGSVSTHSTLENNAENEEARRLAEKYY
ncbi:MAG: hypothetical protein N3F10_03150 [Candidatus Bathyarchaeota archaeon]|nr:hypothetical protein [Candidatus Bathyarchaeota archaeon]